VSDLIERLERTPEYIDTDKDQRIVDMCDEAVNEILRLRNRVWELEDKLHAARVGACEVSDEKDARIRELEERLHECTLDLVKLTEDRNEWIAASMTESRRAAKAEQQLADRDAQWERACHDILFRYEGVNIASHDLVARIKARLDAEQEQKEVGRE
jgi:hypothetical protein